MRIGKASICPQMNTMKVLVNKIFELGGSCKWPSLAMWHDTTRLLGGVFCVKMKFVVFEM